MSTIHSSSVPVGCRLALRAGTARCRTLRSIEISRHGSVRTTRPSHSRRPAWRVREDSFMNSGRSGVEGSLYESRRGRPRIAIGPSIGPHLGTAPMSDPPGASIHHMTALREEDFAARVERHRPALRAHCYRMTASFEDAEDLVQETLLRAWRRQDSFEGRSSLRGVAVPDRHQRLSGRAAPPAKSGPAGRWGRGTVAAAVSGRATRADRHR